MTNQEGEILRIKNIELLNNEITIRKMDHPSCVTSFIRCVNLCIKRKVREVAIKIDCSQGSVFPDACLPISVLINFYPSIYDIKFNVSDNDDSYINKCGFFKPYDLGTDETEIFRNPLNKIFVFSEEREREGQVANLVQSYIDCLSRTAKCGQGVLSGLIWCINEIMDNVLVHSESKCGYVMAQYHKKKKVFALCVYDCGIGIYSSLKNSSHKPASEIDALTLAIQEGVGDGKGQGNGLYGLFEIVKENGGRLVISSGRSTLMLKNNELDKFENNTLVSANNPCTTVDFQLNLSKDIDLQAALSSFSGFDGFDIRIDDMWQDDNVLRYDVFKHSSGTGTRIAGEELRNDVLNTIQRVQAPITLDFANVHACSSSFIDEFLSKMIIEMGLLEFNRLIRIENMNSLVSHLFDRSTALRFHQNVNNEIDKSD